MYNAISDESKGIDFFFLFGPQNLLNLAHWSLSGAPVEHKPYEVVTLTKEDGGECTSARWSFTEQLKCAPLSKYVV